MRFSALLGLAALLLGASAASAQLGGLAAGEVGPTPSHAWIVFPDAKGRGATIFHIPPRGSGSGGVRDGDLRFAGEVQTVPMAAAAAGGRLHLLFGPPPAFQGPGDAKPRRVLTLGTVQDERGTWRSEPTRRLDVGQAVSGSGGLAGFVASDAGLFALRRERDSGLVLEVARDGEWHALALPPEAASANPVHLAGIRGGAALVWTAPTGPRVAFGRVGPQDAPSIVWEVLDADPRTAAPLAANPRVVGFGDEVILAWSEAGNVRLASVGKTSASAWRELPTIQGVASDFALAALESEGRIVVVSPTVRAGRRAAPLPTGVRITELSVATGRVLYSGELRNANPVSHADYVLLAAIMFMVIGMVAVTIISPGEGAVVVPEGMVIAEPARRFIAGLIDLALGMVAVTMAMGTAWEDVLRAGWWWSVPGQAAFALAGLAVVGAVLETLFGRTPGKLLTGCEVVSVSVKAGDPAPGKVLRRPGLWRSLLRNLVKWGVPPAGMFSVMSPGGRHRSDQFGRTAVVTAAPPEPEREDER